jgi:hypothetical protein
VSLLDNRHVDMSQFPVLPRQRCHARHPGKSSASVKLIPVRGVVPTGVVGKDGRHGFDEPLKVLASDGD